MEFGIWSLKLLILLFLFFALAHTTYALNITADPALAEIKPKGLFHNQATLTVVNPEDTTLRYDAKVPEGIKVSPASFTLIPHETQKLTISGKPKTNAAVLRIVAREGDAPGVPVHAELQIPIRSQAVFALTSGMIPALIGAIMFTILAMAFRNYIAKKRATENLA